MELYNVYRSIVQTIYWTNGGVGFLKNNARPFALALGVSLVVFAALFVLQGVGLFVMSEKRGLNKKYLCFIPFANIYQIGRLTGTCDVFGHKMKRAWLYVLLTQVVGFLLCLFSAISEYHLFVGCGDTLIVDPSSGYVAWETLTRSGMYAYNFYKVSEYLISIVGLIESVLLFILVMGLFKKYSPRNYLIFSWLTIFIPMSRFVLVFVVRNNKPIDFNEYMRKRREAYARRAASYGGNPYGNPYGGSPYGNPYGGNPYASPQEEKPQRPPEEPFSEFSKEKQEPFSEFSPSSDSSNQREGSMKESCEWNSENPRDDDDLFD